MDGIGIRRPLAAPRDEAPSAARPLQLPDRPIPAPVTALPVAGADAPPRFSDHPWPTRPPENPSGDAGATDALASALLREGTVEVGALLRALALRGSAGPPLSEVLRSHALLPDRRIAQTQARLMRTRRLDPLRDGLPDPRLVDRLGAETCLRLGLLPWRDAGGVTLVATADPAAFLRARPLLAEHFGTVAMALLGAADLREALLAVRGDRLARHAETRVAEAESCRSWPVARLRRTTLAVAGALLLFFLLAPVAAFAMLAGIAIAAMLASTALKLAAAVAALRRPPPRPATARASPELPAVLPMVTIMVPLFRERDIAGRLLQRLGRLQYPRERLEVLLIAEEVDAVTRATLAAVELPGWMRVVEVPDGSPRTKPRALNFALAQARGSIVGVYDAEDAPDPDQLMRVARHFAAAPPDVACLQGMLDYYNPSSNWLARCFTVEYATWFRLVLPGLARLGLVVPLGGTTLFFRRDVLDRLGGWDAHNVTEDADLGLRLARHGWRTEVIATVTGEEANCRLWPWVRQRSRWIKGYAVTWAVHMRDPRGLLRQLGWWRFTGVQVVFLGSLIQVTLAPLLWSFWLLALGLGHPLAGMVPLAGLVALTALFLTAEAVNIALGMIAVGRARHRFLRPWVPTLHLYFPLAALAAWKGLGELLVRPFYWDKTDHGLFDSPQPQGGTGRRAHRPACRQRMAQHAQAAG